MDDPDEMLKMMEGNLRYPSQSSSEFIAEFKDYTISRLEYLTLVIPEIKEEIAGMYQDLGLLETTLNLTWGKDSTIMED